jgi:hypothetical protein
MMQFAAQFVGYVLLVVLSLAGGLVLFAVILAANLAE